MVSAPQHEFTDDFSSSSKRIRPELGAVLSDKLFLDEIPDVYGENYPNVGVINFSKDLTISPDDVQTLSILYPNLKSLGINGNNIAVSEISSFITACQTFFPLLTTLNVGCVNSQTVQQFEEHATNALWEAAIRRDPPRLKKKEF